MLFFLFLLAIGLVAYAQSPSLLGDYPLAVKTPYLQGWALSNNHQVPNDVWPNLFTQSRTLGWLGMIRIDGQTYQWLGGSNIGTIATTAATDMTPTKTIFTIRAGHMKFNATFFTPIEPNNYTRQSIPFTYLFVDGFVADDGQPHTIQLYSDISAEWVSHDDSTFVSWDTQDSGNIVYHRVHPLAPHSMVDNADSTEDGTAYYATPKGFGLTWQTGAEQDCRRGFANNGILPNTRDVEFRVVEDRWPVFSFAIDLGSVAPNHQPDPVVWTLGLVRESLVNYATQSGPQSRTGHYWSAYSSIDDVISDFLGDFSDARARGEKFDEGIRSAALKISVEYAGILSLVTRQVFASMDITIPASDGGQPSASDVRIFMKDISMSTRANPVEVIYAAFPALLYFNASFARDLLLPLFEFQSSSSYTNGYASPDLGTRYPTISGNTNTTKELAIEHCGNMLIMAYAHAAKSGDGSLISKYHPLLQKWAEYLTQNSLHTNGAVSADGIGYSGMSNLALKGILGVYSMGKIDEVINPSNTTFKDKASELIQSWKSLAVADGHIQAEYEKPGTWGLMYNLFPAVWLQTGLIEDDILNSEAQYYLSNTPPGGQSYSLDNDKGSGTACPHWALMTAAIVPASITSVRDTIIQSTYFQAYNVSQHFPLPMRYTVSSGGAIFGTTGSAAQGAAFGILAMNMKNVPINAPTDPGTNPGRDTDAEKKIPVDAIVGGTIGGLGLLLIVTGVALFWRRRQMQLPRAVIKPLPEGNATSDARYLAINNNHNIVPAWTQSDDANIWSSTRHESSEQQEAERLYNDRGREYELPIAPATPPIVLLSSKERGGPQPNHQNERESASGYEGGEALRAEVDELRREMEAIRSGAPPPPSYQ